MVRVAVPVAELLDMNVPVVEKTYEAPPVPSGPLRINENVFWLMGRPAVDCTSDPSPEKPATVQLAGGTVRSGKSKRSEVI